MKRILNVLTILFLTALCAQAQAPTVYDIRVINAKHFSKTPRNWNNREDVATYYADIARHHPHDVTVYQYTAYYEVAYYQQENDSIVRHGFNITESGDYDKAEYTWNKDTLNLQLYSANGKTKVYKGFGHGSSNSLQLD